MSEQSQKTRIAIDLDDLERQLRGTAVSDGRKPEIDPLAELAKLVGQNDPLSNVFNPQPRPAALPEMRLEPRFEPEMPPRPAALESVEPFEPFVPYEPYRAAPTLANELAQQPVEDAVEPAAAGAASPTDAELRGALDEFDAIFGGGTKPAEPAADFVPAVAEVAYEPAAPAPMAETPAAGYDDPVARDLERVLEEHRQAQATGLVQPAPLPAGEQEFVEPPAEEASQPRSLFGKGMIAAGLLVAVAVGGVGAAALWRGGGKGAGGEPPVIRADSGPTKVQPQNPGGAEIAGQDKQIYERPGVAKPAETKVVNRVEQPVDVQALARAAAPTQPAGMGAQPATAALGEPRKVRTIAIRPDGSVIGAPPGGAALSPASAPPAPVAPVQETPPGVPAAVAAAQATPPVSIASAPPASPPSSSAAAPAATTEAAKPKPPAKPTATPAKPKPPVRPAAPAQQDAPAETAALPVAPAAAPATERTGGGGFAVQLAAPGSDSEARSTFASLQRRFPDELGDQRPVVRKVEVGGRAVYRLRVGPMSRDEAQDLCSKLQGRGGQCFIARN